MKKQEIITRLRKFMEDANGEGSWKEFVGSQLEGDVANFVMSEDSISEIEQFLCPCCGSDATYKTEAYHCSRCAVTTEV